MPIGKYAIRMGVDASAGHGCFPPQIPVMGSNTCFTNMIPQVRVTDSYTGHSCPPNFHPAVAAIGSVTVYCDMLRIHRNSDALSCGDSASNGTRDTFASMKNNGNEEGK